MARKGLRGMFGLKGGGQIPGIGGGGDGLVQSRASGRYLRERARQRARVARSGGQHAADTELRGLGVPIFDRNAGSSELGGYTSR